MAGQHRVEALKLFLRRTATSPEGDEGEQLWWICDFYDRGTFCKVKIFLCPILTFSEDALPAHLNVKLRANRPSTTLPDSHGQVWMELVTLAATDSTLFQGSNADSEMVQMLSLSSRQKFPMRRLATLWKNSSWKAMITRWCQTAVGRATFNVSTWIEMASRRVDNVSLPGL